MYSNLVREYFDLLKGMGATVYTTNGCPVNATEVFDVDEASVFIRQDDHGAQQDALVNGYLAIAPKKPIDTHYFVPEEDSTVRMKTLRGWLGRTVKVFMPTGFQLTGTIKSYGRDAVVLYTSAYGTPARDVLLLETSTIRLLGDNK